MDLADGVVLILTPEGSPAGTGFVVSSTLLVTCFMSYSRSEVSPGAKLSTWYSMPPVIRERKG